MSRLSGNRGLTRDDLRVWTHVARSTDPLKGQRRAEFAALIDPEPAPPRNTPALTDVPPAAPSPAKPSLPPLGPMERRMRRKVSRGHLPVDGVIDLHGMRQSEAHAAMINFIMRAHRERCSIVLIITGKGGAFGADHSGAERGVLRRMVPHWLTDPVVRRFVIGFEPAARGHGGEGSLYVRIRKPRA